MVDHCWPWKLPLHELHQSNIYSTWPSILCQHTVCLFMAHLNIQGSTEPYTKQAYCVTLGPEIGQPMYYGETKAYDTQQQSDKYGIAGT